ncbi:MAG: OmpA family protein [Deltaproteobacteria bacterium]|nr:OmpA family protein [Deltaproteobacteria bacterium]MBK8237180.1 OmpA family protein [Deltaproteobacteria bacterium]MBP7291693.1 OmpA family protein [Nannocystaceae bacterium]
MRRPALILLVTSLSLLGGCKAKKLQAELDRTRAELSQTKTDLDKSRADNDELSKQNKTYEQRIAELEGELTQLNAQIEDLAKQQGLTAKELADLRAEKAKREAELKVYKDLFSRLKALVDAGTIEVQFRKGRMVVKLSDSILFDSGKTKLRPEGVAAVAQLVPALKSVGDREFLVSGHTDNVPIKTARFKSNWELSTARAVVMVDTMIEQGYPAAQLGAAGFGEFDPVAANDTPEQRAQNRRIEIVLMPLLGDIPGMQEMLTKH